MRYLIYGLLFISTSTFAQSYPVPVAIFDTMVFDIRKGRACDSLQRAYAIEIKTLGQLSINQDKAIKLSESLNSTLTSANLEYRTALSESKQLTEVRAKNERKKGFRRGITLGGIACLLVLLL